VTGRIGDLLLTRAAQTFVGREEELALLERMLDDEQPLVFFIHALVGTGKTRLLEVFAGRARRQGAVVIFLDCRTFEPTADAMLGAIGAIAGGARETVEATANHLGALGDRVVLIFDAYESISNLDSWLRDVFIPLLPTSMRVVLSSRNSPEAAWLTTPGWSGLFQSMNLQRLSNADSLELLRRSGIEGELAEHIAQLSGGVARGLSVVLADGELDMSVDEPIISRLYKS